MDSNGVSGAAVRAAARAIVLDIALENGGIPGGFAEKTETSLAQFDAYMRDEMSPVSQGGIAWRVAGLISNVSPEDRVALRAYARALSDSETFPGPSAEYAEVQRAVSRALGDHVLGNHFATWQLAPLVNSTEREIMDVVLGRATLDDARVMAGRLAMALRVKFEPRVRAWLERFAADRVALHEIVYVNDWVAPCVESAAPAPVTHVRVADWSDLSAEDAAAVGAAVPTHAWMDEHGQPCAYWTTGVRMTGAEPVLVCVWGARLEWYRRAPDASWSTVDTYYATSHERAVREAVRVFNDCIGEIEVPS
jgi:hypothetical protein